MTTTYSAIIVDDEPLARRLIATYLSKHTDITLLGECEDGLAAVEAISHLKPDFVFLDVQMPGLTGLEVLAHTGRCTGIIFTTAYDHYAVAAFDQHAVDYLLKPFSQTRFDAALQRARERATIESLAVQQLIADTCPYLQHITLRDRGQEFFIDVKDIDYIQAEDDYIHIHWQNRSLLKTQGLSDIEKQLDPTVFVRIHRSTLIKLSALSHLERPTKDSCLAVTHGGIKLPVSRSGLEKLRQHWKKT